MPPIFLQGSRAAFRICSAIMSASVFVMASMLIPGTALDGFGTSVVLAADVGVVQSGAGDDDESREYDYAGDDLFCIQASVISHDERPLGAGFEITATGTEPVVGTTNGSGVVQFDLALGTWTFSIRLPDDYMAITPAQFDVTILPTFAGCHDVRFKLKRVVPVTVIKLDQYHKPLAGWIIRADPGPGFPLAKAMPTEATTDNNGEAKFLLTQGDWVFSEKEPTGVMFAPVVPVNGKVGVNIVAPGPHVIYFKNRITPKGCIHVEKWAKAEPGSGGIDFPLAQWRIDLRRADGTIVESKLTNINGHARFTDLPFGPYWVEEESRIGWQPINPPKVHVVVDKEGCTRAYPAASVAVKFENRQDHSYCIEGRKVDENGYVGLPGWTITARPLDVGGFTPANQVTSGLGKYRFELPQNDYRIPGSSYEVCEVPQAGWENVTPLCQTVKIWDTPGMCEVADDFVNRQKPIPTVEIPPAVTPAPKQPTPTPYPTYTPTPTPYPTYTPTPTPYHPKHGHGHHHGGGYGHKVHKKPHVQHCATHHVVKKGEGLFAIGSHYGKSAQEMINANPEVRKHRYWFVYVGQKLCIP